jgi:hypothetical protein
MLIYNTIYTIKYATLPPFTAESRKMLLVEEIGRKSWSPAERGKPLALVTVISPTYINPVFVAIALIYTPVAPLISVAKDTLSPAVVTALLPYPSKFLPYIE